MHLRSLLVLLTLAVTAPGVRAEPVQAALTDAVDNFRPLTSWATPNDQRLATGRPGPGYWQQQVDYDIAARLDETDRKITATAEVTYHNRSPSSLDVLWFELVQNRYRRDAMIQRLRTVGSSPRIDSGTYGEIRKLEGFPGGFNIKSVSSGGRALSWSEQGSFLRIVLPAPLKSGSAAKLHLSWSFVVPGPPMSGSRAGWRPLRDGEPVFQIGEWYPRAVAYTDYGGWRLQPFINTGEFTLEFGDFHVALTVPADHVLAATGVLLNSSAVYSEAARARLARAASGQETDVVTRDEALAKKPLAAEKTWIFAAKGVRDFAWASSRRYMQTAKAIAIPGRSVGVMAMAFYPPEAAPLWGRFGLAGITHSVETYSRAVFAYPCPVVQAAFGPVGGMEYPMLAFSAYAPDAADGIGYSRERKHEFLWVLVHEVGHNWFPLTVNSDERRWGWMDEGLNAYVEHLAMIDWSADFEDHSSNPRYLDRDVLSRPQTAIMTPSDLVVDSLALQYHKPAAALLILRETILGRERFDRAFRAYAAAWRGKRPQPEDFFRTIEQEAGEDLSWFWRGWFYATDPVNQTLEAVTELQPELVSPAKAPPEATSRGSLTAERNAAAQTPTRVVREPSLADIFDAAPQLRAGAARTPGQDEEARGRQAVAEVAGGKWYALTVRSTGIVMPIALELQFVDGGHERLTLPAEIWRRDAAFVRPVLWRARPLARVVLDPEDVMGNQSKALRTVGVGPNPERLRVTPASEPLEVLARP